MSNPAIHNCFFIKRDITDWYENGSLWDRITGTNGYDEFEGLFPGCYWQNHNKIRAITGIEGGANHTYIFGINSYINIGNDANSIHYNHLVCGTVWNYGWGAMNDTDTTAGGYYNSYMNQTVIGGPTVTGNVSGTINEQLYNEFGSHLKTYIRKLSSNMNENYENSVKFEKGGASAWVEASVQAVILSESEVLGTNIFGNFYDTGHSVCQLPIFRHDPTAAYATQRSTVRNIASKTCYGCILQTGQVTSRKASYKDAIRCSFILA